MKKTILFLISFSCLYYITSAQNAPKKCLTCKNGMHDGLTDNPSAMVNSQPKVQTGNHFGNGNSTFGQSYVMQHVCGMNYIINGLQTTTRYTQSHGTGFPTTVAMAGLPVGFTVQQAYLYYGCSYTEPTPPATSVAITNPALVNNTIASVMIGDGGAVCWGETGTCGYRCDITSMISGNGNYVINITGMANAAYEVDGVTLVIIYVDPAATYSGNISLWDGDMANWTGGTMTYTGTGISSCTASSAGSAFSLQGDCQNNVGPSNVDNYNGSIGTFPNNFWNTNVINTSVAANATSATYTGYTNNSNDCWLWTMVGLYWQYPTCSSMTVTSTDVNPSCGLNSGSITLNVSGGAPPYTYSWSPNVSTSASATGLSAGIYTITINDGGCSVTKIIDTLTMVNLIISDTVTNVTCNGLSTGTATFNVTGGTTPYTYTWTPNVSSTNNATGLSAGQYTVVIEDFNGCQHTINFSVTQPSVLTASVNPSGALCNGMADGSAIASAIGGTGAYTYLWAPGGGTSATGTGLSAGIYTMLVTDSNGCTARASGIVTQPTPLAVAVTGPPMICIGGSGTLTANVSGGTAPYAYSWSSGLTSTSSTATITPLSSQTYTVYITDANGCKDSGEILINLGPTLFASITGATSMCKGLSTTLCGNAKGGTGGNTYTWEPGGLATPCVTVSPTSTTIYTLSIVDNCGTTATTTAEVLINPAPVVNFAANLYQGCTPLCIQFYNTTTLAQGGQAASLWDYGNGDTSHAQNPAYCYPDTGKYSIRLTVTSDSGCSSTLTKTNIITAYQHPVAAFTYSPQFPTILAPTIQFTDASTDINKVLYWSWHFGDESDSTSSLQNPAHTYHDTGTYCANLVIMDSHGCTDTATDCLVIAPDFNLYIPSAFSPNGDAKNPTFEPKGQYIKSFEMYIFDRWGMQLYHTTDITKGWNGTVGGGSNVAQEDTYIYKILVTDSKNKQHTYIGNVTLIK